RKPIAVNRPLIRACAGRTSGSFSIVSVNNTAGSEGFTLSPHDALPICKDVGARAIASFGSLALGGTDAGNYTLTGATESVTISAVRVDMTGTRAYDGTTSASFSILSVSNKVGSEDVTVASGSGTLASKDVGARAITSFGSLALGGTDAGNYTLTGTTGSVTISTARLDITANNDSKYYGQTKTYGAGSTAFMTGASQLKN